MSDFTSSQKPPVSWDDYLGKNEFSRSLLFPYHHREIFGERLQIFLVRDFVLENLQNHIVSNRIFPLSGIEQALVEANRAAFAFDVLLQNRSNE